MTSPVKAVVLTASDRSFHGEREDQSGLILKELLSGLPAEVVAYKILPDDRKLLAEELIYCADQLKCDLILTTGGTGLAPRDQTPEATLAVIEKEAPGITQAIRQYSLQKTPMAMLSRAIAGVRGRTLIINLPGSPVGVRETFGFIQPVLMHAVELIRGEVKDCQPR